MEDFSEIGINDIEVGVELFNATKIIQSDLMDAITVSRIRTIADFLNNHSDPSFIIGSITKTNKNPERSNLEHLYDYVILQNKRNEAQGNLEKLNKELQFYE